MFDWIRLSKEDYELVANCKIIEFTDIAKVLASFEAEESGVYGDSQDLIEIERIIVIDREYSEIDKAFNELWDKWTDYLMSALMSGRISYANVTRKSEVSEPLEEGCIRVSYGVCAINANDFWDYLCDDVDSGNLDFDLDGLIEYLGGKGSAPSSRTIVKEIEVTKEIEVIKEIEVLKEVLPEDYHKKLANKKHAATKPLKSALYVFLEDDLSGNCTCTNKQSYERIFNEKYKGDNRYLKRETGGVFLSLKRAVSEVLQKIESGTCINRHENTKGFSFDKLPPTCIKHPQK
jgi:hypothetical protein